MRAACIDIGSNTTRLLVAEVAGGRVSEVLVRRAFTQLGYELRATGHVSPAKVAEVSAVVAAQRVEALEAGAGELEVVATAALRAASNQDELVAAIHARTGLDVRVLTGQEEARLAFLGATRTLAHAPEGAVAVVDVGGGSTEIAVGTCAGGVTWSASLPVGSGALADAFLGDDPPSPADLAAIRERARAALAGLRCPAATEAVAVGGSAASLRRVVGDVLEPASVRRALAVLSSGPAAQVAGAFGLAAERVRLLPAGLLVLSEASALLGLPLRIGTGGLREGVCLELARTIEGT